MNFKKLRYNLLVIGLVALVACYLGMSFLLSTPANDANGGSNAGDTGIVVPEPPEDDPGEDDPSEVVDLPTDAYKLLAYSLDILNNGKGYESSFKSSVSNTASGVSAVQYMDGKVLRGVNSKGEKVSIEENYLYSFETGMAGSMVARFFKGFYENRDTGMTQVGITNSYNYSAQTFDLSTASRNNVVTTEDALNEFKILQGLDFPIKINASTTKITNDDPRGKTYRKITVSVTNFSSLSKNFVEYYSSSGQMKDVEYSKINITFNINKKTGYIASIVREEAFSATAVGTPLGEIPVSSKVTTVQTFTNMNKAIALRDSL